MPVSRKITRRTLLCRGAQADRPDVYRGLIWILSLPPPAHDGLRSAHAIYRWANGPTRAAFDVAKQIGLDGVQVSMGVLTDEMHLRRSEVQKGLSRRRPTNRLGNCLAGGRPGRCSAARRSAGSPVAFRQHRRLQRAQAADRHGGFLRPRDTRSERHCHGRPCRGSAQGRGCQGGETGGRHRLGELAQCGRQHPTPRARWIAGSEGVLRRG